MKPSVISIIGVGNVGATIAYTLLLKNLASELLLYDCNDKKCKGEVLDLTDALPFSSTSVVRLASYDELRKADIIIIAAGKAQLPGQSRRELFTTNKKVVSEILQKLQPLQEDALVIMVTNPVDLMTLIAVNEAKLPHRQVMGSGTWLDTQRIRNILSKKFKIAPESVDIFVIGEHGEDQIVLWETALIGGVLLSERLGLNDKISIAQQTKDQVYKIIEAKGATYYGVACAVADLCQTIIFNESRVLPVSTWLAEYAVCLSMPVTIDATGIKQRLDIPLSALESDRLAASAQKLKQLAHGQ